MLARYIGFTARPFSKRYAEHLQQCARERQRQELGFCASRFFLSTQGRSGNFFLRRFFFTASWLSLVVEVVVAEVLFETDTLEEALAVELLATLWRMKRVPPKGSGSTAQYYGACRGACWCLPTFSPTGIDTYNALATRLHRHPALSDRASIVAHCIKREDVTKENSQQVLSHATYFRISAAHLTNGCFYCLKNGHTSRSAEFCFSRAQRQVVKHKDTEATWKVPRYCREWASVEKSVTITPAQVAALRDQLEPEREEHREQQKAEAAALPGILPGVFINPADADEEADSDDDDCLEWGPTPKRQKKFNGPMCARCCANKTREEHRFPDGKCKKCERMAHGTRNAEQQLANTLYKQATRAALVDMGLTTKGEPRVRKVRCTPRCPPFKGETCPKCECGRQR